MIERVSWVIEHRSRGLYLGLGAHPRTGKMIALFRADDSHKPAMTFVSVDAASVELANIASDVEPFAIVPLKT